MTTEALPSAIDYTEDGVTVAFAVPFRFIDPSHVQAERVIAGVATTLAHGSDYAVSGGATDAGGTLTLTVPGPAGSLLRLRRRTPRSQLADYRTSDSFPAESHEQALDKMTLIAQEQDQSAADLAGRLILLAPGEGSVTLPAPSARAQPHNMLGANPITGAMEMRLLEEDFRGDPGVDASHIGLFSVAATVSIAAPIVRVRTIGWNTPGRGSAFYGEFNLGSAGANDAYVAANPRSAFKSANARYFRLASDQAWTADMFGAVGDNATNDQPAFAAALATGRTIHVMPGTYLLTSGLSITTSGQRLIGAGENVTVLRPVGNFNVISLTGPSEFTGVESLRFDAIGMTGGYLINIDGAERVRISQIRTEKEWNFVRVRSCNVADFMHCYGQQPRGPYVFHFDAADNVRSDVLRLFDCNWGGLLSAMTWTGIYAVGPINTIQLVGVTFVNSSRGMHIVPSGAGQFGEFFFIHDLEVDYSKNESIRLEAGKGYFFTSLYAQGAELTEGIHVGAACSNVNFHGGMSRGALKEGMVIAGRDVHVSMQVTFNSFGGNLAYDAVRVAGTAKRVLIANSLLGSVEGAGTQVRYGVSVEAGARQVRVVNCDTFGALHGPVLDLSGGSNPIDGVTVIGTGQDTISSNLFTPGFEIGVARGSGATATAVRSGGVITSVTVTAGGSEYDVAPVVAAIDPAGGSGFAGTAIIANGVITGVTVTSGGTGYGPNTKIAFWNGGSTPQVKARWPGQPNISARMAADGTGSVELANDRGIGFRASADQASSVNFLHASGRAAGSPPELQAQGSDTNIDLALAPKGTGLLKLGGTNAPTAGSIATYLQVKFGATTYKIPLHNN